MVQPQDGFLRSSRPRAGPSTQGPQGSNRTWRAGPMPPEAPAETSAAGPPVCPALRLRLLFAAEGNSSALSPWL